MSRDAGLSIDADGLRLARHSTLQGVVDLLGKQNVSEVTANYYGTAPIHLEGITVTLALTFGPNGLCRIELLSVGCSSISDSYEKMQSFLVKSFGSPEATGEADGGFMFYSWSTEHTRVMHTVIDRFVLSEMVILSLRQDV